MADDLDKSIGDEATLAGQVKRRQTSELSLGDQRTLGDNPSGQDTVIDDIEVVDLDARYKVEGTLGQGGMGAVLLATDTRLDRKVAIKRILGEAAGNRMAVQRFLTEAKAIAALNHPNIVQIYDYGRAKDGPFLIMEYVDGGSLLDKCRESALPIDEAIDLACQLCDGLAKAHDLGIIHRDIKPANVLLTKDGIPKLTDFGLAKAQAGDHGQTMTGAVIGTPDFMPPEQRRDVSLVDHRSDLWSLAATVYQMVTGRSPQIIRFDLLPYDLARVLGKALEENKDERHQSALELRDALTYSLNKTPALSSSHAREGQCPACGIQNAVTRKFCRGCGGALEWPCMACNHSMPAWEEICGACGGRQTILADENRAKVAALQMQAEDLLRDSDFDRAAAIAAAVNAENYPRLQHIAGWCDSFRSQVEEARERQTSQTADSLNQAAKQEAAHDYLSAISALEAVPRTFLHTRLKNSRETVAQALVRLRGTQKEIERLDSEVRRRIADKAIEGMLPIVDRLVALSPNRQDIQKFRNHLIEREAKQVASRDEAVSTAQRLLAKHDYERAAEVLASISPAAATDEVLELRSQATARAREVRILGSKIRDRVDVSARHDLLEDVEKYLSLKPNDTEAEKIRRILVDREAQLIARARSLEAECKFDAAVALLSRIPMLRRSEDVIRCIEQCKLLDAERRAAAQELAAAQVSSQGSSLSASLRYRSRLAIAGIKDTAFASTFEKAQAIGVSASASLKRYHRARRRRGLLSGFVWLVVLVMMGLLRHLVNPRSR